MDTSLSQVLIMIQASHPWISCLSPLSLWTEQNLYYANTFAHIVQSHSPSLGHNAVFQECNAEAIQSSAHLRVYILEAKSLKSGGPPLPSANQGH